METVRAAVALLERVTNQSHFVIGSCKDPHHISRLPRHRPGPRAESAVLIDGLHPFVQKFALGLVLVRVLTFCFQNQEYCRS